jgi:hypothetical protein
MIFFDERSLTSLEDLMLKSASPLGAKTER